MAHHYAPAGGAANRFIEHSARGADGGGGRAQPARQGSPSTAWSRPQSSAQRVLVILIENGGIDLGIGQLVDQLLSAIPGSSLIPDSVRQQLRDDVAGAINEQFRRASKELLESVELAANRYNAAKPDLYGDVIILRNSAASYQDLKSTLLAQTAAGKLIDLFILTHGGADYIAVAGDINGERIRQMRQEAGRALSIRSVYMMNCVGASLNRAWLDSGARVVAGTVRNNYLPEPTLFFFWRNWQAGQAFEAAVTSAYAATIELINDAINGFIGRLLIPGLSSVDVRNFGFVADSAPVIDGQRSLTINSDDISFANSASTGMTTTMVPTARLHTLSSAASTGAAQATSAAGFDFIRRIDPDAANSPAAALLRELAPVEEAVRATAAELNQNQFDALVSLARGITVDKFNRSTLAGLLRRGELGAVGAEMRKWTRARVDGQLTDLPELVRRRGEEADLFERPAGATSQSIGGRQAYGGAMSAEDSWDTIARQVFGKQSYDDFVQTELGRTTFLGRDVDRVHGEMISKLRAAEASLQGQGVTRGPEVSSTLRQRHSMHGWGMAVDFNPIANPYILNEAGETELDRTLRAAYDHIANVVLGLSASRIGELARGRAAFGNDIGAVYDALRAESDAMRRYFALMGDGGALGAFLANEWPALHAGQAAPAADQLQAQMREDYETLGGATAAGAKRPVAGGADRPFAPTSGRGRGDPAGGFLNIERNIVLALTDAGLAWGAIDLGRASGDVMHFDCRLSGLGQRAYAALIAERNRARQAAH